MAVARCERKRGNGSPCGGVLTMRTDNIGRVIADCAKCARRKAGVCEHCPQPVQGKVGLASLCRAHKAERERTRVRLWARVHRGGHTDPSGPVLSRAEAARVGGLSGGKARAAALTAEQRRAIASKAGIKGVAARRAKEAERQRKRLAYLGRAA